MSRISGGTNENASKLLELAKGRFGKLNEAEEKLFRSFADGELADYSAEKEKDNDPAKADKWGSERVLDADRIAWLCTNLEASAMVTHKGILVRGARIDGKLNLQFVRISFPLYFEKSAFPEGINLLKTEVGALYLSGTHTGAINADGLKTDGDVFLDNGFRAEGLVLLIGAKIGGNLQCANGQFINKGAEALNADRIRVEGSVLLGDGFKSEGEVRLVNANIGGVLACYRGLFINEGGKALNADSLEVGDNVLLRAGFQARGNVSLISARIGGNLDCFDALFINKGGVAIDADAVKVEGSIFLRDDFKAEGEVRLVGARIRGDLACDNGQFINKGKLALSASDLKAGGRVFLRGGFKSEGEVRLVGAVIGATFDCENGQFINKGARALGAERLKVNGNVFLRRDFRAEGEVNLLGATIGGDFVCEKGQFINKGEYAISASGIRVKGNIYLRFGFKAEGEVNLLGATIGSDIDCSGGRFINHGCYALNADGVKIEGNVFLRDGFEAEGKVRLYGATIGGSLDCRSGQFINKDSEALVADGLNINGSIFLNEGFKAEGQVRLYGATIRVNLDCINGWFINQNAGALIAERLDVNGSVFLRDDFKAEGEVNLVCATIGGNLDCHSGRFINPNGIALRANGLYVKNNAFFGQFMAEGEFSLVDAEINGFFYWMGLASTENVRLDLRLAKIGTLRDEQQSWPEKGELFLHGLVYGEIHNTAPRDAESRIDWLQRQVDFNPQPYEQLAEVMHAAGAREVVRKVLIARENDRLVSTEMAFYENILYSIYGILLDYGYYRWKPLLLGLVCIALGSAFFGLGYRGGLITPHSESSYVKKSGSTVDCGTKSRELSDVYPKFNFLVYSIDTFVPLVDLHQSKYWLPNANRGHEVSKIKGLHAGGLLRLYLWIHIVLGWLLSTLLVVGLTGLVRR